MAAKAAAKRTYEMMLLYLKSNPNLVSINSSPWSVLEPDIAAFVQADTKTAKRDWFRSHGFTDFTFLDDISLAGNCLEIFILQFFFA